MSQKVKHILSFLTCLIVLAVAALTKEGKVFGNDFKVHKTDSTTTQSIDTLQTLSDGTIVINSALLCKDVQGYAGPVPLKVYMKDGKVQKVEALQNSETPDFFDEAKQLLTAWDGKTTDEALAAKVDAVSGATYTSRAIITGVQRSLHYAKADTEKPRLWQQIDHSLPALAALLVVLLGAIVPLFSKNKSWRMVQMALNVAVLGFWTGMSIDYSLLINYVANGLNPWTSIVPLVMLTTAFVYPFFGKKTHYCTHICPCGSLQDLAGKLNTRHKWKMSKRLTAQLDLFRRILWAVLMVLLVTGVWASWMNYEIFVAFIIQSASWVVLALAALFMVLAIWVPRPYCRFVCPTGTLFKQAQHLGK
jgi:hypothetical protein